MHLKTQSLRQRHISIIYLGVKLGMWEGMSGTECVQEQAPPLDGETEVGYRKLQSEEVHNLYS
jgi:hypothetical protein